MKFRFGISLMFARQETMATESEIRGDFQTRNGVCQALRTASEQIASNRNKRYEEAARETFYKRHAGIEADK